MCSWVITLDFRPLVIVVFCIGECSRNTKENIHEGDVEGITLSGQPSVLCLISTT